MSEPAAAVVPQGPMGREPRARSRAPTTEVREGPHQLALSAWTPASAALLGPESWASHAPTSQLP